MCSPSPEYAQPMEPSESARLLGPTYPTSDVSVPKIPPQPPETQWSQSEDEEVLSDFDPESYSTNQSMFECPYQFIQNVRTIYILKVQV